MFLGYLLFILPAAAVLSLIFYIPCYLYGRKKYGRRPFLRHLTIFAFFGVNISILYITIFSFPLTFHPEFHFLNLIPFVWVRETYAMVFSNMIKQLVLNIIMLVPYGIFLPAVFLSLRKWWKTTLFILLFVVCIETFQYFIGRSADMDDVIMNTLGGAAGYGMFTCMNLCFNGKKWWSHALNS